MGRAPCCDKAKVKKGPWSPEEDAKLKAYIEQHGTGGNWIALPQKVGLKRCGKSCRLRWLNYLRPNIRHGGFTEEEDNIICSLYISIGSRWSIIASQLPGRTDNDIKNYWNTKLKKKLYGKQRKELANSDLKHETKKESQNFMFSNGAGMNQTLFWPELPAVSVPMMNPNQGYSYPEDQTSDLNMFIKKEERSFKENQQANTSSTSADFQYSTDVFPAQDQDQIYGNSLNMLSSSEPMNPLFGYDMFEFSSIELNGAFYGSSEQLEGLVRGSTGTSSAGSVDSSSWGADINSLVYPPVVSDYEGRRQEILHDSAFEEEARYFGPH